MYNAIQFGTPLKSCSNAKHGTPPKQPWDPCRAQGKSRLLESPKTESNVGNEDPKKRECQLLVKHARTHAETRAYAQWSKRVGPAPNSQMKTMRRPGRRAQHYLFFMTQNYANNSKNPTSTIQNPKPSWEPKSKIENPKPKGNIPNLQNCQNPENLQNFEFQSCKNLKIIQTQK